MCLHLCNAYVSNENHCTICTISVIFEVILFFKNLFRKNNAAFVIFAKNVDPDRANKYIAFK